MPSWVSHAAQRRALGTLGFTVQEALMLAGSGVEEAAALNGGPKAITGVYVGCMYTEYLDNVLAPAVRMAMQLT